MVYIIGDTHCPIDIHKLNTKNFPQQKHLTKNDYVIICGDAGFIWDNSKSDLYWRKWLDNKNFTTLFIDGNHENFDLLETFPIVDFLGGKARKISESIYHLMRGEIYTINGEKYFCFGGGESSDKEHRIEGKTWWKQELPSQQEINYAINNLKQHNNKVDYIITHCGFSELANLFDYKNDILTDFLQWVKDNVEYKLWFCGHYHVDMVIPEDKICIMYDDIWKNTFERRVGIMVKKEIVDKFNFHEYRKLLYKNHIKEVEDVCLKNDLDNLIEKWHNNDEIKLPLHEYLGFSEKQWEIYLKTGKIIRWKQEDSFD